MGTRYILTEICPKCGFIDNDVYFAPTCGITNWTCPKCKTEFDLSILTGITEADASNLTEIERVCKEMEEKHERR